MTTEGTLPGVLTVPQSRRPVPVDSDELASLHRSFVRAPWGLCLRAAGVWLRTSHRLPIRLQSALPFAAWGPRPTCTHTHTHTQTYMYIYIYMYISPHLNIDPVAHGSLVSAFARVGPHACIAAAQEGSSSLLRLRASPDDEPFALAHLRAHPTLRQLPLQYPWSTRGVPVEYPLEYPIVPCSTPRIPLDYPL